MSAPAVPQAVIVRTYPGKQSTATAAFQKDAEQLAKQGYHPTAQTWAPGSYGCAEFLAALILCFILIGFIVFVYMLLVKPAGALSVTYEYRAPAPPVSEKVCPRCAETVKDAATACRFCGHEFATAPPGPPGSP